MKKLDTGRLAQFCHQLNLFLSSGIPLLSSLQMLNYKFMDQVVEKVSHGHSLAQALNPFLPALVISAVESAEQAGNLEEVLSYLAGYYEKRAETEDKIKSALVYPCFVIVLCLISLIMIFGFVLPGFQNLFIDMEIDLPLFTRILIFTGKIIPLIIPVSLLVVFLGFKKLKGEKLDALLLKSKLFARTQISHACRTLGSLLHGGLPISQALTSTIDTIASQSFKKIMENIKEQIENGAKLHQAAAEHAAFPAEAIQMLKVGENTGRLSEMLFSIADYYEKERELFIKRFTALLEPGLTLFVGLIVAMVALAMFLPMLSIMSQIQ